MTSWVPKNYKEVLVRYAKDLLRQCEALNGSETADGFEGDQVRFSQNIVGDADRLKRFAASATGIRFDELSAPLELRPE